MPKPDDRIEIQNFISPGHVQRVDRTKYMAMREALMSVLPVGGAGLSVADAKAALLPMLPEALFPGGAKAGWWLKAVQLDLEAKGVVTREPAPPVRLFKSVDPGPT